MTEKKYLHSNRFSVIIKESSIGDFLTYKMKTIKIICIGALLAVSSVGCAVTQNLPSVTVGPKANSGNKLLGASAGKEGVSLVVPLVSVSVPAPSLEVGEDGKK